MNTVQERVTSFIVFFAPLAVYLIFPTKNYYWDGIEFAQIIESTTTLNALLFHPSHLIYNPVGYILYKLVGSFGIEARAVTVLQTMNSVFSALSAFVLFHILKKSFHSAYLAGALTFLFSFSALWWKFSTDANSYIPSVLFLLVSFYFILPDQKPKPLLIALLHSLAMCFHQLAIFFFPVIVLGLYFQSSALPAKKRALVIAQYAFLTFVIIFGSYYLSFYLQTGSGELKSLFSWLTYYSTENGFLFNLRECLKYTLNGQFKLFFGGRLSYLMEVINPLLTALIGLLVLIASGLVFQIVHLWKKSRRRTEKQTSSARFQPLISLCAVWAAVYLIFLFFWIPQNTFYRMFYLPSLIVLIGVLLNSYRALSRAGWRTLLFVVIVAISNFLFYIYPYSQVRRETPLSLTEEMNQVWSSNSVVYFSRMDSDNRLLRYFNPAASWVKLEDSIDLTEFQREVERIYANGGEVWMETTAINRFMQQENVSQWFGQHSSDQSQYKLEDPAYNMTVVKVTP